MLYATRDDMIQAFGEDELIQLTDRADPPLDAIDDDVLGAALAAASSEIDGYVARVATLPLAMVPDNLRQVALAIARYRLSTDQAQGRVRLDYEDAMITLRDIAKGVIKLDLPDGEPAPATPARVLGSSAPQTFTPARLGRNWP